MAVENVDQVDGAEGASREAPNDAADDKEPAQALQPAQGGGSESLQAFRAQLAREAEASGKPLAELELPNVATPAPSKAAASKEARTAERKLVSGRARVLLAQGARSGRMVDISEAGACVLLEDALPARTVCTLECDIFHQGAQRRFSLKAVSIYSVLAGGKGFKVGFQFGSRSPDVEHKIRQLLL